MDRHNFLGRNIKKIVAKALKARSGPGIKASPGYLSGVNHQAFRRSCATWAQQDGTVKDEQTMLRHASPAITQGTYMQAAPASGQRAVETVDEKLR